MEYRVLGKLEVLRDGESVDLGPFRQRALLALLLTSSNMVVSTDSIINGLWGDEAGTDKQNALWVNISGLRKALEPGREKRSKGTILLTRSPGYLLDIDRHEIDATRFEGMVAEGRALADTDPGAASLVLGEALALWRGRAYEDFTYESFAQTEIARLEELRLEAVEARIDADLKRGMSRQLVSELESLVRQHPLRERFTGQLMLALYRSGRQAEALRDTSCSRPGSARSSGSNPPHRSANSRSGSSSATPRWSWRRLFHCREAERSPGPQCAVTSCGKRSVRAASVLYTAPTSQPSAARSPSR